MYDSPYKAAGDRPQQLQNAPTHATAHRLTATPPPYRRHGGLCGDRDRDRGDRGGQADAAAAAATVAIATATPAA